MLIFLAAPSAVLAQKIDQNKLLKDIEYLSSDELGGRKPLSEGNLKARKYIQDRFKALGIKSQYQDYTQYFDFNNSREGKLYEKAANIVGFIGGKETDKLIVVMAHYDHIGRDGEKIFNGADDNASGTGGVLAIAEYFSKNRPNHSMLFVALDAEEMGHQGAKALVNDFPFPIDQAVLNINMDMISRNIDGEIYAVGTYHYPQLKPTIEKVAEGRFPKLLFGHDVPGEKADWTYASDHSQFHRKGIPFIYFGVEDHDDYHKETDTFDRIQPEFYIGAVELILDIVIAFDRDLNND
ncbi:M28 family peptidase [Aquiflexum sp. LQ15W]|uniref:M28 family peptidase n=1 Tax=Cognataquiflexum nitidum TaxID=2922272 RepID=UPI001F13F700|nr:M28 family peptidase [Cognataquiflexum nitidum]MCH6199040.1 M28 family peptidase [Cognataquiflexum nitidum]